MQEQGRGQRNSEPCKELGLLVLQEKGKLVTKVHTGAYGHNTSPDLVNHAQGKKKTAATEKGEDLQGEVRKKKEITNFAWSRKLRVEICITRYFLDERGVQDKGEWSSGILFD